MNTSMFGLQRSKQLFCTEILSANPHGEISSELLTLFFEWPLVLESMPGFSRSKFSGIGGTFIGEVS